MNKEYLPLDLCLFGEEAGTGEAQGAPDSTQPAESGDDGLVFEPLNGQDAADNSQAEGKEPEAESEEDRRKAYNDLKEKYKDLFAADTQGMINRRFKQAKQTEARIAKMQAVIDAASDLFDVSDGDPEKILSAMNGEKRYWEDSAEKAGFEDVDKFRAFQRMRRENEAVKQNERDTEAREKAMRKAQEWQADADALKAKYPDFDLDKETEDPVFLSALKAGVPMEMLYAGKYHNELAEKAVADAKAETEKAVVDNIRARGMRPSENASSSGGSFALKTDVRSLTNEQMDAIVQRVLNGESITL